MSEGEHIEGYDYDRGYDAGYFDGVYAFEGLMGMFRILAARERAKPLPVEPDVHPCQRRHPSGGSVRCNLENDHTGPHRKIGRNGAVLYTWPWSADT